MFNWAGIYRRDFLNKYEIRHQETPGASFQDNGFWFQVFAFAERVVFIHESYYRYRKDNPNSSINNRKKVFCMCDEYDFAKEKVSRYPEIWRDVYYAYLAKRYGACSWTLRKLAPELRPELCDRLYRDFSAFIKEPGEIDRIWRKRDPNNKQLRMLLSDRDEYLNYMEDLLSRYTKNIETLLRQLKGRQLVIFGCGNWGTELHNLLLEHGMDIVSFCDNSAEKQGKEINGVFVRDLETVRETFDSPFFVVASAVYNGEITRQLTEARIGSGDILVYRHSRYLWD